MNNCGDCEHAIVSKAEMEMIFPYCKYPGMNGRVVPHEGTRTEVEGKYQIEFWRVPTQCILHKGSESKCHPDKRTIISFDVTDIPRIDHPHNE